MHLPESAGDHDLAARVAAGDAAAFDAMFRAQLSPLCRYIHSFVRTWDVAEDLAQGVFLQLWVRLRERELPPVRNVQAYLWNAARCDALDWLRRQQVQDRNRHALVSAASDAVARIEPAESDDETASREVSPTRFRSGSVESGRIGGDSSSRGWSRTSLPAVS